MRINEQRINKAEQPILFDSTRNAIPGSFDDDALVRGVLSDVIHRNPKSRDLIAEEMSVLLGRKITKAMLDCRSAQSQENHFWPLSWTRAFCEVTGDWRLITAVIERSGLHVVDDKGAAKIQLADHLLDRERADREISALRQQIEGK